MDQILAGDFGEKTTNVQLDTLANKSEEMRSLEDKALAENTRLMYVGMTRARDFLVLTPGWSAPTPGGFGA